MKDSIPSIKDQTPWKTGFFDFGKASGPNTNFFNPAIIQKDGHSWLIARKEDPIDYNSIGKNSLVAFRLDENRKPEAFIPIDLSNRNYKDQHWEDPRIIHFGGEMLLSCCTFQLYRNNTYSGAHQQVAFLNSSFQPTSIWDPIFGDNGGSILMNTGPEKNWIFFEHEGQLMMIYMTEPHHVLQWEDGKVVNQWKTDGFKWSHGQMRGGSNPIRLGDEYLCFFHSSIQLAERKRRYYMGAYTFEAKPPFRITKMTGKPILSGSSADKTRDGHSLVVFPCGAILERNNCVVSMGINDYTSAWIEIPVKEIVSKLK